MGGGAIFQCKDELAGRPAVALISTRQVLAGPESRTAGLTASPVQAEPQRHDLVDRPHHLHVGFQRLFFEEFQRDGLVGREFMHQQQGADG